MRIILNFVFDVMAFFLDSLVFSQYIMPIFGLIILITIIYIIRGLIDLCMI